ncbi:MAG: 50S ribosomal protein L19e [Nanoarchaeota archaeon]
MKLQKKLAAKISKVSKKRIKIDLDKLEQIGGSLEDFDQSITKNDVRSYLHSSVIRVEQAKGVSRVRAKKRQAQRRKGRRRGVGSRKGKANARQNTKTTWIQKTRAQRAFLAELKEKDHLDPKTFRNLYRKVKGGFFRSKRHIKLFIEEHGLKHGKK